jgi:hypothetical protein
MKPPVSKARDSSSECIDPGTDFNEHRFVALIPWKCLEQTKVFVSNIATWTVLFCDRFELSTSAVHILMILRSLLFCREAKAVKQSTPKITILVPQTSNAGDRRDRFVRTWPIKHGERLQRALISPHDFLGLKGDAQ